MKTRNFPASVGFALLTLFSALHAADGSLSFDGAGDYVEVPDFQSLQVTAEVTVEFWARTNTGDIQQSAFMLSPDDGNNRFQAHISYFNGNTYWDCGDIGGNGRLFTANPAGSVGNWTHYAFVASQSAAEGKMKIYVNGVQVASKDTMDPWEAAAGALRIGGSPSFFLNGRLDDFRVWNVARSGKDIRQFMTVPLVGDEDGLRLYLKFDEGTGTTAINSAVATGANFNGTLHGNPVWSAPARTVYTVNSVSGIGSGSLRQAFADAAAANGPALIVFDQALSGAAATLTSEIVVSDPGNVTVDAGGLPNGFTLFGVGTRLLSFEPGTVATLRGLTLQDGTAVGAVDSGRGGAIRAHNADITLDRCLLHSNSASSASGNGGAVFADGGSLRLTNCTFTGNTAGFRGGAIFAKAPVALSLTHCTVTGNSTLSTDPSLSGGGGIFSDHAAIVLANSIVSGNTSPVGVPDGYDILADAGSVEFQAANLVKDYASLAGNTAINGPDPMVAQPNLAALAANGGPTRTMLPNPGSPAIDAAAGETTATDQRGLSRPQNGTPEIGAVEVISSTTLTVRNTADSGPGSLRQVVRDAAFVPGTPAARVVTFDPALSGGTIVLLSGEIVLGLNLSIDGTGLPEAPTISGNADIEAGFDAGGGRIFDCLPLKTVALRGLTLVNGAADPGDPTDTGSGGAIRSSGELTLDRCHIEGCFARTGGALAAIQGNVTVTGCVFSDNSATQAGAIFNSLNGTVSVSGSTFARNSANLGGAIDTYHVMTVSRSTLMDNSGHLGGAIHNGGTLTVVQCTFSRNSVDSNGGGIQNEGTLTLTRSTLFGNTGDIGGIETAGGTLTMNGTIVAGSGPTLLDNIFGSFSGSNNLIGGDPRLLPLGDHGGPTLTMPPRPGSPARDAAAASTLTSDQRGFPLVGAPDIGAAEAQIGPIADTVTNEDVPTPSIPFAVGTVGTLSVSSSDPALAPAATIQFGGSGAARTIAASPAADRSGTATITVTDNLTGETQSFQLTVRPVNDPPVFAAGADVVTTAGSGPVTVASWATGITAGPPDESGQGLAFQVGNDNNGLFLVPPSISLAGVLTFTPAPGKAGTATVTVTLGDDGGTANGGVDTSVARSFTISIEASQFVVTSTADSGAGSLRDVIAAAGAHAGADIVNFSPAIGGAAITLSGEIVVSDAAGVTIDATELPGGIDIQGGGASRLFRVAGGSSLALRGLRLAGGNGAGGGIGGYGGAVFSQGTLALVDCSISNCNAPVAGGAIAVLGGAALNCTLERCTLSGNSAGIGGAIQSEVTLALRNCTIHGNAASAQGGGISAPFGRPVTARHCTVSGNTAGSGGGGGGGLIGTGFALANCIVAGNGDAAAGTATDDVSGTPVLTGNNLIGGAPLLAPLGSYGGRTPTAALLPGSPARNAAAALIPAQTADQRGFPIVGIPDIGAYEAGTLDNFPAFAAETPGAPLSPAGDADNDGRTDFIEYATATDPRIPGNQVDTTVAYVRNAAGVITGANLAFPTRVDPTNIVYTLQRSRALHGDWVAVATWNAVTGVLTPASGVTATRNPATGVVSVSDADLSGKAEVFYQLKTQAAP